MPELVRKVEELRRPRSKSDADAEKNTNRLNNELLNAGSPKKSDETAKRNSKNSLIEKILQVSEKYELDVQYSDTKLKRMNKNQLTKVLAHIIEESVKIDMCKQVGCAPGASPKVMGLAALRMMHDICATGFEKGAQAVLPQYGYDIDGFSECLKEPTMSQAIDQCLTEIAAESPEILQYFESPYARLALSWSGALLSCLKKRSIRQNASNVGSRNSAFGGSLRNRMRGGPPDREEHGDQSPTLPNVLHV
jgi:hypothetical protein